MSIGFQRNPKFCLEPPRIVWPRKFVSFKHVKRAYLRGRIDDLGNGIEYGIVDAFLGLLRRALPTMLRVIVTVDRVDVRLVNV